MNGILGSLALVAGAVVTAGGAATVLWRSIRWLYRAARKAEQIMDFIEAQLTTNGGHSLRDAVDRIEHKIDDHIGQHRDA